MDLYAQKNKISGNHIEHMGGDGILLCGYYPGTKDVADSFLPGKKELKLQLTPEGRAAGLTLSDLARQVRAGFYGAEVQRIQRGQDEVKVMVRFPLEERDSVGYLDNMKIRTPDGGRVPFHAVAEVEMTKSPAFIQRYDRERAVRVYRTPASARYSHEPPPPRPRGRPRQRSRGQATVSTCASALLVRRHPGRGRAGSSRRAGGHRVLRSRSL